MAARAEIKSARARDAARDTALAERRRRDRSDSRVRLLNESQPDPLPPPQDTESLQTLRARVGTRSVIVDEEALFRPPWTTDTVEEACRAAAQWVEYYLSVAITEYDRELVAARAFRAVATAVSTTPTYPVFVAAVTMGESMALILSENPYRSRHYTRPAPGIVARRRLNALNAAVAAGMAAHAEYIARAEDDDRPPDYDCISHADS